VRRRTDVSIDAETLIAFVRARLATAKAPRAVTFVDEFPLTSNGKIQKFRLRALLLGE
jgi:fatty-acyl-CoA synthase